MHAREYAEILAAPGQVPVVRGNGANYGGNNLFHVIYMRANVAKRLHEIGPGVVYLQEADTCPQTVWSCSARREYENMVIEALEGLKGAKIWITRLQMTRERRSQEMYRRRRENPYGFFWITQSSAMPTIFNNGQYSMSAVYLVPSVSLQ